MSHANRMIPVVVRHIAVSLLDGNNVSSEDIPVYFLPLCASQTEGEKRFVETNLYGFGGGEGEKKEAAPTIPRSSNIKITMETVSSTGIE